MREVTPPDDRTVTVAADGVHLGATLSIPARARGLVMFAHGSGSSRHSPRNRFVAEELHKQQLATLLLDLLTEAECALDEETASLRFDIPFLSKRLADATDWVERDRTLALLPVGYFGASTGAAAALIAAAERRDVVKAIVSRGGRPDLAAAHLSDVRAPTLLIVGGADPLVAELNRRAWEMLRVATEARLDIVPGATHLFEEPGALAVVAELAARWFVDHLVRDSGTAPVRTGTGTSFSKS